ncbi:MAG: LPS export ABC transporter periplasmic protein LptC [Pseudomonadales bacterium]|jgi:lipopolysaccharide export system protein LptC|nr:LPS export ABC transporter periplasmic protein LptC [Pseudomonadales bacterium]
MLTYRLLLSLVPAVLLIAALVLWLPGVSERGGAANDDAASPLDADFDYFASTMHRASFNAQGQTLHTLEAMRVVHYPADDHTELEHPALVWYPTDAAPWTLSANAGTLHGANTEGEDRLELRDNVVLRYPLSDGATFTVHTARLDAVPATQDFSTEQPVTLDSPDMHMDSIGMRGNLRDHHVELLHEVRGRHAPLAH